MSRLGEVAVLRLRFGRSMGDGLDPTGLEEGAGGGLARF
jgi:hypothetical protein